MAIVTENHPGKNTKKPCVNNPLNLVSCLGQISVTKLFCVFSSPLFGHRC